VGWLPVHRDQLRGQRSITSMGNLYFFLSTIIIWWINIFTNIFRNAATGYDHTRHTCTYVVTGYFPIEYKSAGYSLILTDAKVLCGYMSFMLPTGGGATGSARALDLWWTGSGFKFYSGQSCITTLGKLFTTMCLCHQAV